MKVPRPFMGFVVSLSGKGSEGLSSSIDNVLTFDDIRKHPLHLTMLRERLPPFQFMEFGLALPWCFFHDDVCSGRIAVRSGPICTLQTYPWWSRVERLRERVAQSAFFDHGQGTEIGNLVPNCDLPRLT